VLLGYDVIRDDGQLVRFVLSGGTAVAPPSISFQLQQTANGLTLTDDSDDVEAYDTNGKLQSITKRTGIAQTMSYDGLGRLETVTDTVGRSLTLAYDAQGRLLSVRSD
jgi:YD repeat-containing protein